MGEIRHHAVFKLQIDGTLGSCTSCHTRHSFSVVEARKPEACDQCHLGPDHPQIEIYEESKHGTIYHAYKDEYNFDAAGGTWTAGVDYRAPTCAACHMSGTGKEPTSHDVTQRLSWETQAPLTVRPQDFAAFPSGTNWQDERQKMKNVCSACHGDSWINDFYDGFDKAVEEYNEVYFKPAKKTFDELNEKGLLDQTKFFDERLEVEYYELWHHEGRRARHAASMMGPDYTHWHGTYDLAKHWYSKFIPELEELIAKGKKAGGDQAKAAADLQAAVDKMLNSDDHKWYLDKLTDAQKAMRKAAVARFKDQMEGKVGTNK